jgi:hypothetical protein
MVDEVGMPGLPARATSGATTLVASARDLPKPRDAQVRDTRRRYHLDAPTGSTARRSCTPTIWPAGHSTTRPSIYHLASCSSGP